MTVPFKYTAAVVALSGCLVAGCSSSSSPTGGSGSAKSATSSSASSAPAATSSSPAPTASSSISEHGDPNSTFCVTARKVNANESKQTAQLSSAKPATVKKFVKQTEGEFKVFSDSAPSAIKSDVDTVVGATRKLYSALAAKGYDIRKIATSNTLKSLDSAQFKSAAAHIQAYLNQVCKIKSN